MTLLARLCLSLRHARKQLNGFSWKLILVRLHKIRQHIQICFISEKSDRHFSSKTTCVVAIISSEKGKNNSKTTCRTLGVLSRLPHLLKHSYTEHLQPITRRSRRDYRMLRRLTSSSSAVYISTSLRKFQRSVLFPSWGRWVIALMMEAVGTSKTLVNLYEPTQRYKPEDNHLRTHRSKELKSHLVIGCCSRTIVSENTLWTPPKFSVPLSLESRQTA
jgi:hypothetical protein